MMPSRGTQIAWRALQAPRHSLQLSARNFSSRSHSPLHVRSQVPGGQNSARRWPVYQRRNISWNPATWIPGGSQDGSKEFEAAHKPAAIPEATPASSAPTAPTIAAPEEVNLTSVPANDLSSPASATELDLDNVTSFNLPVEEGLGYLKSLGLDYGYGPTSILQWTLEHVHVLAGAPWWVSIIVTSTAFRLLLFPLTLKMSDASAKMTALKPHLDPIHQQMTAAMKAGDTAMWHQKRQEMKDLKLRAGLSLKWTPLNALANVTLAYCGLKMLRHMAELPVPSMLDGGALWFTNLTLGDPYWLIPIIMGLTIHASFRLGTEVSLDMYKNQPAVRTLMLYGLPFIVAFSMVWFSAAANLWLAGSGLVSVALSRVMLNPEIRDRLGLAPMPKTPVAANPYLRTLVENAEPETAQDKIINVRGVRKSSSSTPTEGGGRYQAPNIRTTPPRQSTTLKADIPKSSPSLLSSVTQKANEAAKAHDQLAADKGKDRSLTSRYVAWGTERINDMGETYQSLGRWFGGKWKEAKMQAGQQEEQTRDLKGRSKEYARRAEEYERTVQRARERRKQQKK